MSRKAGLKKQLHSGAETRERLLEAAIDVFGKYGYDAATTRVIAREAGVNIAAIPYYYSSKENLYRAVISHIVDMVTEQIAETLQEIASQSFSGPAAKKEAIILLEKLVTEFITFLLGSPQAPRVARIILREQLYPTAAYDIIFSGFMGSSLDSIARLFMVISSDPSQRTARLRAMAIIGQVIAFRVARETVVRALDMEGYNAAETDEIRQIVMEHTRSITHALTSGSGQSTEATP